ncbi:unnamed protein product [Medioppia subpectinata]|uniref:Uncharacterized protein n=1 Tax=Medioppia subpectinata TaxID=1979941 RepID=A0A7R9KX97_9ACAR|nr:unnamed protein product [Medioppia subpectinata]CAG2111208.1 unnamed protein product [Medioppia subpectinata]
MFRNRKVGIMAIIIGIIMFLVTSMSIMYVNGFTFGLYGWSRTSPSLYNMVLIKPFEHGIAYMTGMFMGYMFADNQYYLRLRAYRLWPKIIIWLSATMASTYALNVIGLPALFSSQWLPAYVAIERAYTSVYWALMAAWAIVTAAEYNLCCRLLSHRWWRPFRTAQHSSFLFHWFLSNTVFGSVVGDVSGRALYGYPIIWAVIALNYAIMIVVSAVFALPFDRLGRSLTAYVFAGVGQRLGPKPATGALKAD